MTCRPFGVVAGLVAAGFALSACTGGGGGDGPAGMKGPSPNELIAECLSMAKDRKLEDDRFAYDFKPTGTINKFERRGESGEDVRIHYRYISHGYVYGTTEGLYIPTITSAHCDFIKGEEPALSESNSNEAKEPDGSPEVTDWNDNHAEQWAKDNLDGLDPKSLPTLDSGQRPEDLFPAESPSP